MFALSIVTVVFSLATFLFTIILFVNKNCKHDEFLQYIIEYFNILTVISGAILAMVYLAKA
jgi:hypothetical protein